MIGVQCPPRTSYPRHWPAGGVDAIECAKEFVEFGVEFGHRAGLFEEGLGGDGEEFGGALTAVGIEECAAAGAFGVVEGLAFAGDDGIPLVRRDTVGQGRRSVGVAILHVDDVGKFVIDDVDAIRRGGDGLDDAAPTEADRALPPGLADADIANLPGATVGGDGLDGSREVGGIDEDFSCQGEDIDRRAAGEQDAGGGGEDDADFVVDHETVAAGDRLFGEEDLDEAAVAGLHVVGPVAGEGDGAAEVGLPFGGEGLGCDLGAAGFAASFADREEA